MKLLYYSPSSYGGIADYAHEQANALVSLGIEVDFLCTQAYPARPAAKYNRLAELEEIKSENFSASRLEKAQRYVSVTLNNYNKLSKVIKQKEHKYVLLGSYSEYLAPLWAGQLRRLANKGVVFGAVVHDPVRDFVLGPRWWHEWSISQAYSFIRDVFVHEPIDLKTGLRIDSIRKTTIPLGVYSFPEADQSRADVRERYQLPDTASVMLAFGHIRDSKNLDLLLHAMTHFPSLYLVVAGKEQSFGQKPASFYQKLATSLNVADRCRWDIKFVSELEVANLFMASDVAVITYSEKFRSASSVLSVASNYRKMCLASSGEGSLKSTVTTYGLGVWTQPDSCSAIVAGLKKLLNSPPTPQWDRYFKENSWEQNARLVAEALRT